jgi:hypothetical protein
MSEHFKIQNFIFQSHPYGQVPLYALRVGHPRNGLMAVSGVARPLGGQPAAVFYPLGHPTPYAYVVGQEAEAEGGSGQSENFMLSKNRLQIPGVWGRSWEGGELKMVTGPDCDERRGKKGRVRERGEGRSLAALLPRHAKTGTGEPGSSPEAAHRIYTGYRPDLMSVCRGGKIRVWPR